MALSRFAWKKLVSIGLFAAIGAHGQTSLGTSSLGGTVTDISGLTIPKAHRAHGPVRGITREALTNDSGDYVITGLPAGRFLLRVTKEGFEAFRYVDFQIAVNQRATVDAVLKVGALTEIVTVNVQGETPLLETASNSLGAVIVIFENSPAIQGGIFPLAGSFFPSDTQMAVVQDTLTISPTLVNLARIGFSRSSVFSKGEGAAGPPMLDKLGVPGTLDTRGVTGVSIQGYTGFRDHVPPRCRVIAESSKAPGSNCREVSVLLNLERRTRPV